MRKFQEIEEKIKDGGQKVARRGRPPSKKSQLINKVAEKEKSILEDKIFDSEEGSKLDKSILVEPKKRSRKRNADLDVSTASQVVKRGRKAPVHAREEAEKEQEKEGGKEGGVKRIRQLEGLTDGHLEYLVEYGPRKHRVMSTLKLIQTHPTSFASYLDSKK